MARSTDTRPSLVRAASRSYHALVGASLAARARLGGLPPAGELKVSYGHPRVPAAADVAVGGIVKLQALERLYPNAGSRFNVLYLVSSRLPDGAVALARAARAKGAAFVLNQNGVAYPAWHGDGWEEINAPMRALLGEATHVFYQSRFCKETADRFLGVEPARWEVLYNAVDTGRFVPAAAVSPRAMTLLLGGTQYAWYRVRVAIETLALVRRHADARLLIAGALRWPEAAEPRAQADATAAANGVSGHVEFLGPYRQADAPGIYARADLLLHTKYNDPCPTTVIEAMACGLPVVYSRSGGVPELVGDAGIGVDAEVSWVRDIPPQPEALAGAVLAAYERRDTLGRVARGRAVDQFDEQRWLARHREVFEALAA